MLHESKLPTIKGIHSETGRNPLLREKLDLRHSIELEEAHPDSLIEIQKAVKNIDLLSSATLNHTLPKCWIAPCKGLVRLGGSLLVASLMYGVQPALAQSTLDTVSTLVGDAYGYADGLGTSASFSVPFGVALDAHGTVALIVRSKWGST